MSVARIKKSDTVVVIRGNDAGKTGTVKSVDPKKETAIVMGLNMHKKAMRRSQQHAGGFVDVELPIPLSKLMLWDADAKKRTRVATGEKDGKKARKLKASGKVI